ncbi:SH3 domain-containing protein [Desulfobaculum sp.]
MNVGRKLMGMVCAALLVMSMAGCVASLGTTQKTTEPADAPAEPVCTPCERAEGVLADGVMIKNGNFREEPSGKCTIISVLPPETEIAVLGTEKSYYRVRTAQNATGYLFASLMAVDVKDCEYYAGKVRKTTYVRATPSRKGKSLGRVKAGTAVTVLSRSGSYYQVSMPGKEGYVSASLVFVDVADRTTLPKASDKAAEFIPFNNEADAPEHETTKNATAQKNGGDKSDGVELPGSRLSLMGYAKSMRPYKDLLLKRQNILAWKKLALEDYTARLDAATPDEFADEIGYLETLERGSIALDSGYLDDAADLFGGAEQILKAQGEESYAESGAKKFFGGLFSFATGNKEIQRYASPGYERVMMLDMLALSYLLQGDRAAYNVTRRAIDLQNTERERFEERMAEEQAKLEEKRKEAAKEDKKTDEPSFDFFGKGLEKTALLGDTSQEKRAASVASAFVNPFADYMNALVLEVDGYLDKAQRENARIAYEKAAKLAPDCGILKKASTDMRKGIPGNKRLVHVILGEGFAPYKQVKTSYLPIGGLPAPVRQAVLVSEPSTVHKADVYYGNSRYRMEQLADFEAMSLRYEQDSLPGRMVELGLELLKVVGLQTAGSRFGALGQIAAEGIEHMAVPDTRNWECLPATIHVQRLLLPKNAKTIKIVTRSAKGKAMGSIKAALPASGPAVVYVRSINGHLRALNSSKMWI